LWNSPHPSEDPCAFEFRNAKCPTPREDKRECLVLKITASLSIVVRLLDILAHMEGVILPRYVNHAWVNPRRIYFWTTHITLNFVLTLWLTAVWAKSITKILNTWISMLFWTAIDVFAIWTKTRKFKHFNLSVKLFFKFVSEEAISWLLHNWTQLCE